MADVHCEQYNKVIDNNNNVGIKLARQMHDTIAIDKNEGIN